MNDDGTVSPQPYIHESLTRHCHFFPYLLEHFPVDMVFWRFTKMLFAREQHPCMDRWLEFSICHQILALMIFQRQESNHLRLFAGLRVGRRQTVDIRETF